MSWTLEISGLALGALQGQLALDCRQGGLQAKGAWCQDGHFVWQEPGGLQLSGQLQLLWTEEARELSFQLDQLGLKGHLAQLAPTGGEDGNAALALQVSDLDLAQLPQALYELLGLSDLEGRMSGQARLHGSRAELDVQIEATAFDRVDGLVAGEALELAVSGELAGLGLDQPLDFDLQLEQLAGELLIGTIYLPPPEQPMRLGLAGRFLAEEWLEFTTLELRDGASHADGGLRLVHAAGTEADPPGWRLDHLQVHQADLRLPEAWQRWGEGPASARGFSGLQTQGRLRGTLDWGASRTLALRLEPEALQVRDEAGRFAIGPVNGWLERTPDELALQMDWQALELFQLHFDASELRLSGDAERWALERPLVLPLLDGAVVIDELGQQHAGQAGEPAETIMDARIEPLDLLQLTRMLGWPDFGGRLSGSFPGIRLRGDEIAFTGDMEVQAFSGRIRMSEVSLERPFGSLPALSAQVDMERLDLEELTGAFNFGHIDGQMSGWLHDLRLLDWRPVAMDARLFTHDDAPRRRISQRAVESISSLGGGSAAGASLLRMFDEFSYKRAGLACRLDRNICQVDGVGSHASGGFYLVQGRGLPRLDVVGHRRLVDWPTLVAQLISITQRGG